MRALRYDRYGPAEVLGVVEIAEPSPKPGEVKVRVHAASLNPLDWKIRAGHLRLAPMFQRPPRGVGTDFAGEIAGVGGGATQRYVGERVFGSLPPFAREGALAECVVTRADRVVPVPENVSYAQAAAMPVAAGTALQALADDAALAAGQRVLIIGAAGGVGHFAVQIAKHLGAYVVGVCSAGNAAFVQSLGADDVVDYAREDFARRSDRFDVVFDAAGASSFAAAKHVLTEAGCYVNTCGDTAAAVATAAGAIVARLTSRRRAIPFVLRNQPATWLRLAQLARDGVLRPHIERTIALDDVGDAQRAMQSGHGRGKVLVGL